MGKKDVEEPKEPKEAKEPKEPKEAKAPKEPKEAKEGKEGKPGKEAPVEEGKIDKVETLVQTKRLNKKYGKVATIELKQRDPFVPRATEKKLRIEIKKMKAITPNEIAAKYDIRVSTVRHFLNALVLEGVLELVSSHDRLKVYNPK